MQSLLDCFSDVLVIPEYPSDVVSHWGLIIGTERTFLHDPSTTSEMDHQRIALSIAKAFAEQVQKKICSSKIDFF